MMKVSVHQCIVSKDKIGKNMSYIQAMCGCCL